MQDIINEIEVSLAALRKGGIILFPAETGWSIGCDATNSMAIKSIKVLLSGLKGKTILLASERDVLQYAAFPDLEVFDFIDAQAQPVIVIYEGGLAVAEDALYPDGSIAIRIVKDDFCRHLVKRLQSPLFTVPVKIGDIPKSLDEIPGNIINGVDNVAGIGKLEDFEFLTPLIVRFENGRAIELKELH